MQLQVNSTSGHARQCLATSWKCLLSSRSPGSSRSSGGHPHKALSAQVRQMAASPVRFRLPQVAGLHLMACLFGARSFTMRTGGGGQRRARRRVRPPPERTITDTPRALDRRAHTEGAQDLIAGLLHLRGVLLRVLTVDLIFGAAVQDEDKPALDAGPVVGAP